MVDESSAAIKQPSRVTILPSTKGHGSEEEEELEQDCLKYIRRKGWKKEETGKRWRRKELINTCSYCYSKTASWEWNSTQAHPELPSDRIHTMPAMHGLLGCHGSSWICPAHREQERMLAEKKDWIGGWEEMRGGVGRRRKTERLQKGWKWR